MIINDTLTLSLQAARINKGLSRAEASRLLGISVSTLSNYERGLREPGAIIFMKMCGLYGIEAERIRFDEKLLGGNDGGPGKEVSHERKADG